VIGTIFYSLTLILNNQVSTVATFQTLEPCRKEMVRLNSELQNTNVKAVCVPTNQISIEEVEVQMQHLLNVVKNFDFNK